MYQIYEEVFGDAVRVEDSSDRRDDGREIGSTKLALTRLAHSI